MATFKSNILSLGRDNYTRVLNDILNRGINRMDAKILQRMSQQLVGSIFAAAPRERRRRSDQEEERLRIRDYIPCGRVSRVD